MGDVFSDASALYLSQVGPGRESQSSRSSRISDSDEWITGTFLKAMIPLGWLSRACRLSGKALATALAIWYLKGLRNSYEGLMLTTAVVERLGISRYSKSRALRDLERAGLIRVERRPQKNPLVTILKVDDEEKTPGREVEKNL